MTHRNALTAASRGKWFEPRPAPSPTSWPPGSAMKVKVMAWRVANGFSLWHPGDETEARRIEKARVPISGRA